jgi:hypothetical protein
LLLSSAMRTLKPQARPLGPRGDEVINIFALAIRYGLTSNDLRRNNSGANKRSPSEVEQFYLSPA